MVKTNKAKETLSEKEKRMKVSEKDGGKKESTVNERIKCTERQRMGADETNKRGRKEEGEKEKEEQKIPRHWRYLCLYQSTNYLIFKFWYKSSCNYVFFVSRLKN